MTGSYPSKDQALAAAFVSSAVGDEVIEHQDDCLRADADEGYCTCEFVIWRLTTNGWREVPG